MRSERVVPINDRRRPACLFPRIGEGVGSGMAVGEDIVRPARMTGVDDGLGQLRCAIPLDVLHHRVDYSRRVAPVHRHEVIHGHVLDQFGGDDRPGGLDDGARTRSQSYRQ